jgi:hypothetical protein
MDMLYMVSSGSMGTLNLANVLSVYELPCNASSACSRMSCALLVLPRWKSSRYAYFTRFASLQFSKLPDYLIPVAYFFKNMVYSRAAQVQSVCTREIVLRLRMMARQMDRAFLLGRGARKGAPDWQDLRWSHRNIPFSVISEPRFLWRGNLIGIMEIAHLHCTSPALAGGARERSAVQVSSLRFLQ